MVEITSVSNRLEYKKIISYMRNHNIPEKKIQNLTS